MLSVIEVICKSGCGDGTTVAVWAVVAAVAAALGVGVGLLQLRPFVRSAVVNQQANSINAVSHCAQRYHEIMRDVGDSVLGPKGGEVSPGSWWYRYWDLHTEQFTLFRSGLLDPRVYELWMNELATLYNVAPLNGEVLVETRAVAHAAYLDHTLPHHVELQSFFRQLSGISFDRDPVSRGVQVRALIDASAPKRRKLAATILEALGRPFRNGPKYQVIVSSQAISQRVQVLARVIESRYVRGNFVVVEIKEGATRFASDLTQAMKGSIHRVPVKASSRSGIEAQPVTVSDKENLAKVKGRHVVIVDDIIETGKTLAKIRHEVSKESPASIALCALLSKPGKAIVDIQPDYVAFGSLPNDKFVVGYGIDYEGHHRDLSYISAVDDAGELLPALGGMREPPT